MYDNGDAIIRWEGQVEEFKMSASYKELLVIDEEPIEFEWNILTGFSSLQLLQKIQNDLRERNIEPEKFTDRIIFMSMFNDIDWTRKGHDGICISNSERVKEYEKRFSRGHWTFLGPGHEKEEVRRKMGLYCHSNGGTIQRYRSSSIQEYKCFESWNSEKED